VLAQHRLHAALNTTITGCCGLLHSIAALLGSQPKAALASWGAVACDACAVIRDALLLASRKRDVQHGDRVLDQCAPGARSSLAQLIKGLLGAADGPHVVPHLAACMGPICQTLAALPSRLKLQQSDLLPRAAEAWAVLRRPGWLDDEAQLQEWGLQLLRALKGSLTRMLTAQGPPRELIDVMLDPSLQVRPARRLPPASAAAAGTSAQGRPAAAPCPPLPAQLVVEAVVVRVAEALDPTYTSQEVPAPQRWQREQVLASMAALRQLVAQAQYEVPEPPGYSETCLVVQMCLSVAFVMAGAACTASFRQSRQGQLRTLAG
jgi:hypothetical protein